MPGCFHGHEKISRQNSVAKADDRIFDREKQQISDSQTDDADQKKLDSFVEIDFSLESRYAQK